MTTLTAQNMVKVLYTLNGLNLSGDLRQGQSGVWVEAIAKAGVAVSMEDAIEAALRLGVTRTAERGDTWVTPGDLIREVKAIRSDRISAAGVLPTPPAELTPGEAVQWQRALVRLIGDGRDVADARDRADRLVGYTRPPEIEDGPVMDVKELINNARRK